MFKSIFNFKPKKTDPVFIGKNKYKITYIDKDKIYKFTLNGTGYCNALYNSTLVLQHRDIKLSNNADVEIIQI